jgi:hypothetical protein
VEGEALAGLGGTDQGGDDAELRHAEGDGRLGAGAEEWGRGGGGGRG